MNQSFLLWSGLAVTLFWTVGLFNRLMRTRARALQTFKKLEKAVRQYSQLVHEAGVRCDPTPPLSPASREPATQWAALKLVLAVLDESLTALSSTPLAPQSLDQFSLALQSVQAAWSTLKNTPADLAGPIVPDQLGRRWLAIGEQVAAQCSDLNEILGHYNTSLAQFPANMIVRWLGFSPAGKLRCTYDHP